MAAMFNQWPLPLLFGTGLVAGAGKPFGLFALRRAGLTASL